MSATTQGKVPGTLEEASDGARLRVLQGYPTEEELAALVVVLAAAHPRGPTATVAPSAWAYQGRAPRGPLSPGLGGWRTGWRVSALTG
ncbi:MAG: acyl-CoA carboxylase epsilon subunit [Actinomycetota bacterium]